MLSAFSTPNKKALRRTPPSDGFGGALGSAGILFRAYLNYPAKDKRISRIHILLDTIYFVNQPFNAAITYPIAFPKAAIKSTVPSQYQKLLNINCKISNISFSFFS